MARRKARRKRPNKGGVKPKRVKVKSHTRHHRNSHGRGGKAVHVKSYRRGSPRD